LPAVPLVVHIRSPKISSGDIKANLEKDKRYLKILDEIIE
jgi:hypothetical protein